MTIEVEIGGTGQIVEFPDGTGTQTIQNALSNFRGGQDGTTPAATAVPDAGNQLERQPVTEPEGSGVPLAARLIPGSEFFLPPVTKEELTGAAQDVTGVAEAAASIGSGIVAQPIAGIAGIAAEIGAAGLRGIGIDIDPAAGARTVKAVTQALTFHPRTEAGKEAISGLGESIIGQAAQKFEQGTKFLGEKTLDITGSPALATAAEVAPTAVLEAIGLKGSSIFRAGKSLPKAPISEGKLFRELDEAAPSIEQLKDTSRAVYKEIDDLNATVDHRAVGRLVRELRKTAKDAGIDPNITPKAATALKRFEDVADRNMGVTDLDNLRKVAQNSAKSLEPAEASAGLRLIDTVDEFLDTLPSSQLRTPDATGADIAGRYKSARQLWGRARKSELIQDAFEKSKNQASGFENGIRTQLRSILNSKKQSRFFNKQEKAMMQRIVACRSPWVFRGRGHKRCK